jgi:hypothetical protein
LPPPERGNLEVRLGLSMAEKVFLSLYRLWTQGRRKVRYEDVVVQAFADYPAEFHLKGYPQYPDSGDTVHKPLYDYRKKGMVTASSKMFSLTPRGVTEAEKLLAFEAGSRGVGGGAPRLQRDAQMEIERVKRLESFRLFLEGKEQEIIDSDLFDYLGVSVRTSRNDFIGRLETVKSMVAAISQSGAADSVLKALRDFHNFIMSRFGNEIAFKTRAPAGKRS